MSGNIPEKHLTTKKLVTNLHIKFAFPCHCDSLANKYNTKLQCIYPQSLFYQLHESI